MWGLFYLRPVKEYTCCLILADPDLARTAGLRRPHCTLRLIWSNYNQTCWSFQTMRSSRSPQLNSQCFCHCEMAPGISWHLLFWAPGGGRGVITRLSDIYCTDVLHNSSWHQAELEQAYYYTTSVKICKERGWWELHKVPGPSDPHSHGSWDCEMA